jgi:hypothetical protein
MMSSTIFNIRSAVFRSVLTQYSKSSRNSGWNIANRLVLSLLLLAKAHLFPEFFYALRLPLPTL